MKQQAALSLTSDFDSVTGPCVYLIHLEKPLKHARHYVGWTRDLRVRIRHHRRSNADSCHFMRAVNEAGISWKLVKVWSFDTNTEARDFERRMKKSNLHCSQCPKCYKKRRAMDAKNMRKRRGQKYQEDMEAELRQVHGLTLREARSLIKKYPKMKEMPRPIAERAAKLLDAEERSRDEAVA